MGPYCNFCNIRCFVHFPIGTPEEALKAYGESTIMATCKEGQKFELEKTGWNYARIVEVLKREYKVIAKTLYTVDIEDQLGYRSSVFQQGDGKWKCLACQRLTCEHAKWVASQNIEMPKPDPVGPIDDILTY